MFRRKDEETDTDATETSGSSSSGSQTSMLGGTSESATVLNPQQAAAYTSQQASGAPSSSYPGSAGYGARPAADAARPAASPFRPAGSADSARPGRTGEAAKPVSAFGAPTAGNAANSKENRRVLTVGSDILLKGEIATCDRLVIEGKVDATLNDVHTVEIAESGSFKGSAQIEYAEISGLFEGELVVKNRLVIYATGKVRGKITYGEIEIERGGELTGEIKTSTSEGQSGSYSSSRSRREAAAA